MSQAVFGRWACHRTQHVQKPLPSWSRQWTKWVSLSRGIIWDGYFITPVYRWGNWVTGTLSHSRNILASGKAGLWIQAASLKSPKSLLFCYDASSKLDFAPQKKWPQLDGSQWDPATRKTCCRDPLGKIARLINWETYLEGRIWYIQAQPGYSTHWPKPTSPTWPSFPTALPFVLVVVIGEW